MGTNVSESKTIQRVREPLFRSFASSDNVGDLEPDCHELLNATLNGSSLMSDIWLQIGRKSSNRNEKSPDGNEKSKKSLGGPEKTSGDYEKSCDGPEKTSKPNEKGLGANHSEKNSKVKLESCNMMMPCTGGDEKRCHKTSSCSDGAAEKANHNEEKIAINVKMKSETSQADPSLYVNQSLWKPWTSSEIYSLLSAVEKCFCVYRAWELDNNTKWDIILKYMNKDGHVFQRSEQNARAKFYSLMRGFKDIKSWKSQEKSPSYETMTFKQRKFNGLPRSFDKELYTRVQAFYDATGLDDGVQGGLKNGEEEHVSGIPEGRITRGQIAAAKANKDGATKSGLVNPTSLCSQQHDDHDGHIYKTHKNNEGSVENQKNEDSDDKHKDNGGDSHKNKEDVDVTHKDSDGIGNNNENIDVNHKSNAYKHKEGVIIIPQKTHKKRVISTQEIRANAQSFHEEETVSLQERHTPIQSFHEEEVVISPKETHVTNVQSLHEEATVTPEKTCANILRVKKQTKIKSLDCGMYEENSLKAIMFLCILCLFLQLNVGSPPNNSHRSNGMVAKKKRKHAVDDSDCGGKGREGNSKRFL